MENVEQDGILWSWLTEQLDSARALADASDILELHPLALNHLLARFHCRSLVREPGGEVRETDRVDAVLYMSPSYLRAVDSFEVVTIVEPVSLFLPNVRVPLCCIGPVAPGTPITDLLYRTFEVITGQNVTPVEWDALDRSACEWARNHPERLPVDPRPLKRLRVSAGPATPREVSA